MKNIERAVLEPSHHHDWDHQLTDPGCQEAPRQHSRQSWVHKASGNARKYRDNTKANSVLTGPSMHTANLKDSTVSLHPAGHSEK